MKNNIKHKTVDTVRERERERELQFSKKSTNIWKNK